ncbi:hypothetical protein WJX72_006958 [[Myrmecia] bisecta]|uniref:Uncharacterized protein n=1 Tax=[Myrmecia] bisecta TaxID=41462 RepID=A0AAW1PQF0_9CHLO
MPAVRRHNTLVPKAYATGSTTAAEDADDYYALLNVPCNASAEEIKRAYYAIVRDHHPDLLHPSLTSADAEEESRLANEFCTFINQVYNTLKDPDKRAAYDDLFGLSPTATNPFGDSSHERDQVFVDEYTCIGCRACCGVCPKSFKIDDEHGRARAVSQDADSPARLQEAIDTCPVDCIHWVTAPQLALLETAMRNMDRADVWIMFTGGGKGVNVFLEASIQWEKRQSRIRARQQQAGGWWSTWSGGGGAGGAQQWQHQQRPTASPGASTSTAVAAAAAARSWREYQRHKQQRRSHARQFLAAGRDESSI